MTSPGLTVLGYAPDFLGIPVVLPTPTDDRVVRELSYPRFTVLLDPERRLAVTTGVNIDGATLRDVPRTGEWFLDDRIPADEQAGNELYRDNDYDRGHLVRRRDPGWGTASDAREATEATFAYPNAAPQASGFNQSPELWLGLEDHVLAYAEAVELRVSVFTAPVLDDDDPVYRGVRIPRRFWKIAAWNSEAGEGSDRQPRLGSAAFVLDQSELMSASAVPGLGRFRTFQVPVADVEDIAGVDLGPLADADVAITAARAPAWRWLASSADIRLG